MAFKSVTFGNLQVGAHFCDPTDDEGHELVKMSPTESMKPGEGWASVVGTLGSGDFKNSELVTIWVNTAPSPRRVEVGSCHYCGCPAYKFNWFDAPVCGECN